MICKTFTDADGNEVEFCLSEDRWEMMTDQRLRSMLGFTDKPAPAAPKAKAKKK
jgi:hypothetical protein